MKRFSLLFRYILTYICIVLISSIGVSAFFHHLIRERMYEAERINIQNRLARAAEDFERQVDLFSEIAMEIALSTTFNRQYFSQDTIRELEMLNDLKSFRWRSPISDSYFLYYEAMNWAYKSSGYKNNLETYLLSMQIENGTKIVEESVSAGFPAFHTAHGSPQPLLIYSLVIPDANRNVTGERAIIFFFLFQDDLRARLSDMIGRFEGDLSVYYRGDLLYQTQTAMPENTADRVMIRGGSDSGFFQVALHSEPETILNIPSYLTWSNLIVLIAIYFLIAIVAVIIAYFHVKPMRVLVTQHSRMPNGYKTKIKDELYQIASILKNAEQLHEDYEEKLKHYYEEMKEQMIRFLLSGKSKYVLESRQKMLGLNLDLPFFGVYLIRNIGFEHQIRQVVAELLDTDLNMYVAKQIEDEGFLAVLVNSSERSLIYDTAQLIHESLVADAVNTDIFVGGSVSSIKEIPESYFQARFYAQKGQLAVQGTGERQDLLEFDQDLLWQLSAKIEKKETAAIQALFSELMRQIRQKVPPVLQRYAYFNVYLQISRSVEQLHLSLPAWNPSIVLGSEDMQRIQNNLESLLIQICEALSVLEVSHEFATRERILRYISDHACEYDFVIDSITEHFHISSNAVQKLLKEHVGSTCKAHIIHLRIEKAKHLLEHDDLSVKETAEKVGYGKVSNFIKKFKEITGYTPAGYKDRGL